MTTVTLYLYDLSGGLAKNMSRAIIGQQIDGIWHTGIVVYNKVKSLYLLNRLHVPQEFYFGGGICKGQPGRTPYGNPVQMIPLGNTQLPESIFLGFLQGINSKFTQETYDLFRNNCNNFTDECAQFLTGTGIPRHIIDLPLEVLKTPMGAMIGNMVSGMQNQANAQSSPMFDPRSLEGANNPDAMNFSGSNSGWDVNKGKGMVLELNSQQEYNSCIQAIDACVIDVFADWCGPCQAIKPFFNTLPSQYPRIRFFKVSIFFAF